MCNTTLPLQCPTEIVHLQPVGNTVAHRERGLDLVNHLATILQLVWPLDKLLEEQRRQKPAESTSC